MEITFEDVIEFVIKNSENRERMDKLNKITFPFTTSYEKKYSTKSYTTYGYQPSYEDLKDIVEAPLGKYEDLNYNN